MPYTTAPAFQDQFRRAILNDLDAPAGLRRSGAAILRQLNRYLSGTKRESQLIGELENTDHYLRQFARGAAWHDERIKEFLWEMYVFEGRLIVIAPGGATAEMMSRLFDSFFKQSISSEEGSETLPVARLVGKFLMYKKSLSDPKNVIVRGFIEFKPGSVGTLLVEEVHVNRQGKKLKPETEVWIGTLLARERSYCMITKEEKNGTPKFAVLEVADRKKGYAQSLRGHSIECIERWGAGTIFHSGVYLERMEDDSFDYRADKSLLDLVPIRELRRSQSHVITHLG